MLSLAGYMHKSNKNILLDYEYVTNFITTLFNKKII